MAAVADERPTAHMDGQTQNITVQVSLLITVVVRVLRLSDGEAGNERVSGGRGREQAADERPTAERMVPQHTTPAHGRVLDLETETSIPIVHLKRHGARTIAEVLQQRTQHMRTDSFIYD